MRKSFNASSDAFFAVCESHSQNKYVELSVHGILCNSCKTPPIIQRKNLCFSAFFLINLLQDSVKYLEFWSAIFFSSPPFQIMNIMNTEKYDHDRGKEENSVAIYKAPLTET